MFNSSIVGIEKSDLILLIGCNPRHEATMVNARIRKAFVKNKVPIYSIGNPGDLTYEYKIAGDRSEDIKNIFEEKNEISKILKKSKKTNGNYWQVSALETKSGGFIFEGFKEFLNINGFINEKWNALNVLIQNASTVGGLDICSSFFEIQDNFSFFDKLENKKFKFLYLLGSDNLNIKKEK